MVQDRSTRKQQELLQFIDGFIKGNGYGPSYREVMRALGYKSVSTVAIHIDGLIARGYLRKRDRSARSIEVITLRDERSSAPSRVESKNEIAWLEKEIIVRQGMKGCGVILNKALWSV
jgi:SOS-response transcriptional repressor LexA